MRNYIYKISAVVLGFGLFSTSLFAQPCSGGTLDGNIVPTATYQPQSVANAGSYYTFTATAGDDYFFSFCPADGGSTFDDTQITILDNTGAYAGGYNDDYCSFQSYLQWNAPSSGVFRVLISDFYCASDPFSPAAVFVYRTAPPSFCIPPYNDGTDFGDYISLVQLGAINNVSGAFNGPSYTYYTPTPTTNLFQGTNYTAGFQVGITDLEYLSVWIDFNDDIVFDPSEEVVTNLFLSSANTTFNATVAIPPSAPLGTHRMRVRDVWNSQTFDACSLEDWGEAEDYDVTIVTAPPIDMSLTAFTSPLATGGCFNGNQTVTTTIQNFGTSLIDFSTNPATVNCSVTGPNPATFPAVVISSGTLAPNATQNVTITSTYNMTAAGTYAFTASVSVSGDGNSANDALGPYNVTNNPLTALAASSPDTFCVGNTAQLNAVIPNIPTNTYTVASIPYAPLTGNSAALTGFTNGFGPNNDDGYENVPLPPGFNFSFFGSTYADLNVETNGYIDFGAPNPSFTSQNIPDANTPNNLIGLCWTDLNVTGGGSVDTFTVGTAPFREFVIRYNTVPFYVSNPPGVSGEIILYETSNIIDVLVTEVSGSTFNPATLGIEDAFGTTAYSPSGRNDTYWSVPSTSPEAWRFAPTAPTVSYLWTPNGTGSGINTGDEILSNPVINPTSTTTYTVTISSPSGCTATATTTVTVSPLPVVSVAGNTNICSGNTSVLTASGASSFVWSPASGLSSTTIANPICYATATTTYTVIGTNPGGCSNNSTVTVTVNPLPTVTVSGTATICSNSNTTLSASGATTYFWMPSSGLSSNTVSNPIASPTTTTTYTVMGTSAAGCTDTATVTITVNTAPTVNLGTDQSQCGGSITLDAQNPGDTYLWSTAATTQTIGVNTSGSYNVIVTAPNGCTNSDTIIVAINPNPVVNLGADITQCGSPVLLDALNPGSTYAWSTSATTQTISVTSNGTYSVVVTDLNGCSNSDNIIITINPAPTQSLGPDIVQCGGTVILNAQNSGSTYLWSTSATTQTINVSTGTYSVLITSGQGCTNSDTITVTVNPIPVLDAGSDTTICIGNQVTLTGPNGFSSYLWEFGTFSSNSQSITVSPGATTVYTLTVTNSFGCTVSDLVTVTVDLAPVGSFTFVTTNGNIVTFTNTSTGSSPLTFDWDFGDGTSHSSLANPIHTYTANGNYTVIMVVTNSCGSFTFSQVITVTGVGFEELNMDGSINMFPNPSSGEVNINVTTDLEQLAIEIYDLQGKMVYSSIDKNIISGFNKLLDLTSLSNGMYSVRINTGNGLKNGKLIIAK